MEFLYSQDLIPIPHMEEPVKGQVVSSPPFAVLRVQEGLVGVPAPQTPGLFGRSPGVQPGGNRRMTVRKTCSISHDL